MVDPEKLAKVFDDLGDMLDAITDKDIEQWTLEEAEEIKSAIDSAGVAVDELWVKLLTDEEYAEMEREGKELDE